MAYSFYGGKEGISFLIKARFESVNEMTLAFSKGGEYNDVGYGEFVIIDTPNKADYENGTVYRRGFDYNTDRITDRPLKTATETITITQGTLTKVIDNRVYWNDTHTLYVDAATGQVEDDITYGSFNQEKFNSAVAAYLQAPGAGAIYIGRFAGPEGGAVPAELLTWSKFLVEFVNADDGERDDNIELERTPGKTIENGDIKITDVTKGGYCTIRDSNGNVEHSYFSFDFPYDVFEVQAESVSPYGPTIEEVTSLPAVGTEDVYYHLSTDDLYYLYENDTWIVRQPWSVTKTVGTDTNTYSYSGLIREKQESEGHPFYYSYDIKVPKGIHGKSIEEIDINRYSVEPRDENGDIISDTDNHNYQWYFEQTDFNDSEEGIRQRVYLNNFNKIIDQITTNVQPADEVFPSISRDTSYQVGDYVTFTENPDLILLCSISGTTASTAADLPLSTVTEGYQFFDGTVKWVVTTKSEIPASVATVHYTHDGHQDFTVRLLQSLELDDNGKLYAQYTDLNHRTYLGNNKSIIGVGYTSTVTDGADIRPICRFFIMYNTYLYNPDGSINFDYTDFQFDVSGNILEFPKTDNNGREIEYIDEPVKFISSITIGQHLGEIDAGTTTPIKRLIIHYNTGEDSALDVYRTIESFYWNDDFKLVAVYNSADPDNSLPKEEVIDNGYEMKYIDKIYINDEDDLSVEKYFKGDYVIGKDSVTGNLKHNIVDLSNELNKIVTMRLIGDNLMVLYSSPTYRASLTNYYEAEYEGTMYRWANLGPILNGDHIIGNFDTLNDLKAKYPAGFGKIEDPNNPGSYIPDTTTQNHMGWIATVGDEQAGYKLYAYDYMKDDDPLVGPGPDNWYMIQDIAGSGVNPRYSLITAKADSNDSNIPENALDSFLNIHGVWFVVSN